jgi:subtilisin family serine protease
MQELQNMRIHPVRRGVCAALVAVGFLASVMPARALDWSAEQARVRLEASAWRKLPSADAGLALQASERRWIVEYEDEASADDVDDPVARQSRHRQTKREVAHQVGQGLSTLRDFDQLPMGLVKLSQRKAMVGLLNHPRVKAVYEDRAHLPALAQSLPLTGQPTTAGAGYKGAGATVVMLDTGLDFRRPEFGGCAVPGAASPCRVLAALDIAPNDGVVDSGNFHGTQVAAVVAGVAPGASLVGLDVFNGSVAYSSDIIQAINWVIGNKKRYNIVAFNLSVADASLNTAECPASWAATPFANARAAGVLPVVAAGNGGASRGVASPACAPGAVRVGAVYDASLGSRSYGMCTDSATQADQVACFSNGGNLLSLLAPGAMITAAGLTMAGTSQAAPHVAGAIAVLRAANAAPNDSLDTTVMRLRATGKPVTDGRNGVVTPRLDLQRAVGTLAMPRP